MGERSEYAPGTPCWVDLATSDADAATAFYERLFGWQPRAMPVGDGPDAGTYVMFFLGDRDVAALYRSEEPAPPHWTTYISVADVDATAPRVAELGGALVAAPFDVLGQGRMAVVRDPVGAVFALWQPGSHAGAGRVNEVGAWSWNDLVTEDPERAAPFYAELLGWEAEAVGGPYTLLRNRGGSIGGIFKQPGHSYWVPYFAVERIDEALEVIGTAGGRSLAGPMDVPAGRIAVASDPQGAVFSIFEGPLDP